MSLERRQGEIEPEVLTGFVDTFISRHDCFPVQLRDGSYAKVNQLLTYELIAGHVKGERTIGTYCLDTQSRAKYLTFDADTEDEWTALVTLSQTLGGQLIPTYLEQSRRGGHLWLFFKQPIPGRDARRWARHLLESNHLPDMEIYPRQDQLVTGTGSLVRLPLGIHKRAEPPRRFAFVDVDGNWIAPTVRDQMRLLAYPAKIPAQVVKRALQNVPEKAKPIPRFITHKERVKKGKEQLSARILKTISTEEFISQFVDINQQGRGLCPFHDDHKMSFGVHREANFWSCFAKCGTPAGGNIIHFWSRWRTLHGQDGSFVPTITEMIELLGL